MSKKFNSKKCRICGKTFIPTSGRQVKCPDCKNKKVKCANCGKIHKPAYTNSDGEPICDTCYRNSRKDVECANCGRPHKPNNTNSDGEPICYTCYKNSKLIDYYNSLPANEKPDWDYVENIIGIHRKREIECWETGKSYFHDFICVVTKRARGKCELTGKKSCNLEVHHLNGYNWCIEGRVDPANAVCIDKAVHKAFHDKYGRGNNTCEQWEEFKADYQKKTVTLDDFR